jgi:hypothetical protein
VTAAFEAAAAVSNDANSREYQNVFATTLQRGSDALIEEAQASITLHRIQLFQETANGSEIESPFPTPPRPETTFSRIRHTFGQIGPSPRPPPPRPEPTTVYRYRSPSSGVDPATPPTLAQLAA